MKWKMPRSCGKGAKNAEFKRGATKQFKVLWAERLKATAKELFLVNLFTALRTIETFKVSYEMESFLSENFEFAQLKIYLIIWQTRTFLAMQDTAVKKRPTNYKCDIYRRTFIICNYLRETVNGSEKDTRKDVSARFWEKLSLLLQVNII